MIKRISLVNSACLLPTGGVVLVPTVHHWLRLSPCGRLWPVEVEDLPGITWYIIVHRGGHPGANDGQLWPSETLNVALKMVLYLLQLSMWCNYSSSKAKESNVDQWLRKSIVS